MQNSRGILERLANIASLRSFRERELLRRERERFMRTIRAMERSGHPAEQIIATVQQGKQLQPLDWYGIGCGWRADGVLEVWLDEEAIRERVKNNL